MDEMGRAFGNGGGCGTEVRAQASGRQRLCVHGHERKLGQMLDFSGIEQMAHDHGACYGSSRVARENRPGIHQSRSAGKIEISRDFAWVILQVEEQRSGLKVIVQARRYGEFTAFGQIEAAREKFAAAGVEDDYEADLQLLKRGGGELGFDVARTEALGVFVRQIPRRVFAGGLVERV